MDIAVQIENDWKCTVITDGRLRFEVTEPIPPAIKEESHQNAAVRAEFCPAISVKISDGRTPPTWTPLFNWSRQHGPWFFRYPFELTVKEGVDSISGS